jgi:hypothetical protein
MTTSPAARPRPRTDHGGDCPAVLPRVDSALSAGQNPEDGRRYRRWTPERRYVVGKRRLVCTPDPPSPERGKRENRYANYVRAELLLSSRFSAKVR